MSSETAAVSATALHASRSVRHSLTFRHLEVQHVSRLTPHMQRVVLGGPELQGFVSASPDDHVKLFFPNGVGDIVRPEVGPTGPVWLPHIDYSPMRDYTPRHHDAQRQELTIDFVLHGDGPAAAWAAKAIPGQRIGVGGPRGSVLIAEDFDHYVLVGDETALPAIGRWLEQMPAHAGVTVLAEIPEAADRQIFTSAAQVDVTWLERDNRLASDSNLLEDALQRLSPPDGDTFYWIATESRHARAMRIWLSEQREIPKDWIKAKGYWKAEPDQNAD
ncbi:MAG: siderophore-interacting protein [Rhodanobacter sp.]